VPDAVIADLDQAAKMDRVADVGGAHGIGARPQPFERRRIALAEPPRNGAVVERLTPERH
jgi:hypothetical protein